MEGKKKKKRKEGDEQKYLGWWLFESITIYLFKDGCVI